MEEQCTIVALATHGLSGTGRWVMGSITARILKASRLPLLIVRPPDIMERSDFTWDQAQLFPYSRQLARDPWNRILCDVEHSPRQATSLR